MSARASTPQTVTPPSATLLSFPRPRAHIGAALKRHRLPEALAAVLARESEGFAEVSAHAALAYALDQRIVPAPLDLERARGILLAGPSGAGKSTVAAKIVHAAALIGRKTSLVRADGALAKFRAGTNPPDVLMVMEADGFNPLNGRAASAFSALGEAPGVDSIGVVSALSDAEDVADLVGAFHFKRVIVTNLDRTRRLGAFLAAITSGAALAHISASPHPEDALETLAAGALSALLLDSPTH
jgi:flagellar biosynthesis protein FlhF